ncbi:MAG: ATP synthase F1 subunit gamma [Planctomycetales bacterium]
MAKARAIVKRLKAVRNIRKITRTMELIATARFKRAMDRATEAAAYTRKMSEIVADLARAELRFTHPLLEPHETEQNCVLLVLTSNRGLCGGYNSGVLRQALARIGEVRGEGKNLRLEVSGKRGINFMKFQGEKPEATYTHFEDRVTFDEVNELGNRFIQWYVARKIDRLDVAYMQFQSASRQRPVIDTLLPIGQLAAQSAGPPPRGATAGEAVPTRYEYEFLPSAEEILQEIVPASFKARLFKSFLDAAVSEQIYRMVAMKGATENADDMIRNLAQRYNRARQAQITNELAEIVGAVAALG